MLIQHVYLEEPPPTTPEAAPKTTPEAAPLPREHLHEPHELLAACKTLGSLVCYLIR